MDILFVAEGWAGKRGGQDVTTQPPTSALITEVGEGKVLGYVRKETPLPLNQLYLELQPLRNHLMLQLPIKAST